MKLLRKSIVFVAFLGICLPGTSQKLKDKLNQIGGGDKTEKVFESQDVIAGRWARDGEYGTWVEDGGLFVPSSKRQVRIYKDTNGRAYKVMFKGEEYKLWDPSGSDWASGFSHDHMSNMCFFENTMIYYHFNYTTKKVGGIKWQVGKRLGGKNKVMKLVQEYLDYGLQKIEEDRAAIAKAEKENRDKYSLKDKEVVAIKPVWPTGVAPDKLVDGDEINIGFELTLADGSVMKTINLGGEAYIQDLEVTSLQNVSLSGGLGETYSTGIYGGYNRSWTPKIIAHSPHTLDAPIELTLTVKSRYEGSGETSINIPVFFGSGKREHFYAGGAYGCAGTGQDGEDGNRGREVYVQVKQVVHPVTKQELHVYNSNDNIKIVRAGGLMTVQATGTSGQCGGDGQDRSESDHGAPGDGGNGGNGGDGGDITLLIDPSVTIPYNFTPVISGGMGGENGLKGLCWGCAYGASGEDGKVGHYGYEGTFTEKKGKVNF